MRFPVEGLLTRSLGRGAGLCAALGLLAACAGSGDLPAPATAITTGPRADFPILIGPSYTVNGISYTPVDMLNYDEVGYAVLDAGTMGITGSHHTLPVPSYVEVTSLESGRTILVRLERRGPMTSNDLVSLSPAAMAQLEGKSGEAVRVRRVNPPEEQRAALRRGEMVARPIDTPMSLVAVLRRELAPPAAVPTATPTPTPVVPSQPTRATPATPATLATPAKPAAPATPPARPAAPIAQGFFVQAAAFSTDERAQRAAAAINGHVIPSGRLFRLRTGPFATREEAQASLAKVRAAGYDDARILTGD